MTQRRKPIDSENSCGYSLRNLANRNSQPFDGMLHGDLSRMAVYEWDRQRTNCMVVLENWCGQIGDRIDRLAWTTGEALFADLISTINEGLALIAFVFRIEIDEPLRAHRCALKCE